MEVGLPSGRRVSFPVEWDDQDRAVVVKDAGDDPDCTDGARMTAGVRWSAPGEVTRLLAGPGIGTVTEPGLGLAVGEPAIDPVPRRMILQALGEVSSADVVVNFSVPGGRAMSAQTTNSRLGIIGGISILGASGVVRPFSTASYRASVVQQIDVAAARGERHMVLATGARSEAAAERCSPDLVPVCFVEVGDFTGIAVRRCGHHGIPAVTFVGMAGKIAELAAGVMMTHCHRSDVDTALLACLPVESGAPPVVVETATATATARHFFEACVTQSFLTPWF